MAVQSKNAKDQENEISEDEEEEEEYSSSEQETCDEASSIIDTEEEEEEADFEETKGNKIITRTTTANKHKVNKKLSESRTNSATNEEEHSSDSIVKKKTSKKRNRSEVVEDDKPVKKRKVTKKADDGLILDSEEKNGEKIMSKIEKKSPAKRDAKIFDDKDVDKNFNAGNPNSVTSRKVKLNQNYMVSCRMIEANETKKGLSYDYAGLIFQRRTKDNSAYEFNLPLSLTPFLINALQYLMNENRVFFNLPIQNENSTEKK